MDEIKPVACVSKRALETLDQFDPPSILPADEYSKRTDVYLYDQQAIDSLMAEVEENEAVIRVWRGRTLRAEAEADALRKDAERYRWLREEAARYKGDDPNGNLRVSVTLLQRRADGDGFTGLAVTPKGADFDAAIDAATKEQG